VFIASQIPFKKPWNVSSPELFIRLHHRENPLKREEQEINKDQTKQMNAANQNIDINPKQIGASFQWKTSK
jgi:hypothetical protein